MYTVQFTPPATGTPNPITIPNSAPDIFAVVTAQIIRLPLSLANHATADVAAALADHAQAAIVAALADHAVHAHDLISQGTGAPPANALGLPAALNSLEDAGGVALHTVAGAGATGVQNNAAAQAHAVGGAPVAHAASAVPVVHAGGNPIVDAVPTGITARTFSLSVNTLVGDMVELNYLEVGERVRV
jgi:hypothetical protein